MALSMLIPCHESPAVFLAGVFLIIFHLIDVYLIKLHQSSLGVHWTSLASLGWNENTKITMTLYLSFISYGSKMKVYPICTKIGHNAAAI